MKSNFIYVAVVSIICLIVGVLTVTGVQSARHLDSARNVQVESSASTESASESSVSVESSTSAESKASIESSVSEETCESETGLNFKADIVPADKPVIYLYSDVDDKYVEVAIDTEHKITCEYPKRDENGIWKVMVYKDGHIEDLEGQEYNYLYWEGLGDVAFDFTKGFCVKGSDSAEFLNKALNEIGLNRKEANEFIVYWLPKLEMNEYNLISFQTEAYTSAYDLRIHPHYDNMLRVYMAFKPLDGEIEMENQDLSALKGDFKREGFHIVEWGGSEIR